MINKNIAFSGFMAAILLSVSANAAQIASKEYVDATGDTVLQTVVTNLGTNYSTTAQTQAAIDAKATEVLGTVDTKFDNYYNKKEVDDKVKDVVGGDITVALEGYAKTVDVDAGLKTKADKATTLAGYGITDAMTKDVADAAYAIKGTETVAANAATAAAAAGTAAGEAKTTADAADAKAVANTAAILLKADKATTLAGYGITDAMTKDVTDAAYAIKGTETVAANAATAAAAAGTAAGEAKVIADAAAAAAAANTTAIGTKANSADVYTKTEIDDELVKKLDTTALDAYATTEALTTGLAVKASIASLDLKENTANKTNSIAADSGSTVKYTTVDAVQTYALPKPSDACMSESAQCVLAINKADGSIYWENVVVSID